MPTETPHQAESRYKKQVDSLVKYRSQIGKGFYAKPISFTIKNNTDEKKTANLFALDSDDGIEIIFNKKGTTYAELVEYNNNVALCFGMIELNSTNKKQVYGEIILYSLSRSYPICLKPKRFPRLKTTDDCFITIIPYLLAISNKHWFDIEMFPRTELKLFCYQKKFKKLNFKKSSIQF